MWIMWTSGWSNIADVNSQVSRIALFLVFSNIITAPVLIWHVPKPETQRICKVFHQLAKHLYSSHAFVTAIIGFYNEEIN